MARKLQNAGVRAVQRGGLRPGTGPRPSTSWQPVASTVTGASLLSPGEGQHVADAQVDGALRCRHPWRSQWFRSRSARRRPGQQVRAAVPARALVRFAGPHPLPNFLSCRRRPGRPRALGLGPATLRRSGRTVPACRAGVLRSAAAPRIRASERRRRPRRVGMRQDRAHRLAPRPTGLLRHRPASRSPLRNYPSVCRMGRCAIAGDRAVSPPLVITIRRRRVGCRTAPG